jgi:hypothetical protein
MYIHVMIHLSSSPEITCADAAQPQPAPSILQPSTPLSQTDDRAVPTPSPPPNLQLATFNLQPSFLRFPGETPRAYSAFIAFFQLGHARSLQAVADKLGESLGTVKNWSSKFNWSERLKAFNSGLLQQQAQDQAARQLKQAADWANRLNRFREQEWDAAQKLLAAAQCFLETFGEEDLRKMTLAQVSRALKISSTLGRSALAGAELPESSDPLMSPLQQQLLHALKRLYGQPASGKDEVPCVPNRSAHQNIQPLTPIPSPREEDQGEGELPAH